MDQDVKTAIWNLGQRIKSLEDAPLKVEYRRQQDMGIVREITDVIKTLTTMVMELDERVKRQEIMIMSQGMMPIDDQSISEPRIREVEERQSRIRILEDPPGGITEDLNWWEHVEKLWKKL